MLGTETTERGGSCVHSLSARPALSKAEALTSVSIRLRDLLWELAAGRNYEIHISCIRKDFNLHCSSNCSSSYTDDNRPYK
jgi:hypothetical protein